MSNYPYLLHKNSLSKNIATFLCFKICLLGGKVGKCWVWVINFLIVCNVGTTGKLSRNAQESGFPKSRS